MEVFAVAHMTRSFYCWWGLYFCISIPVSVLQPSVAVKQYSSRRFGSFWLTDEHLMLLNVDIWVPLCSDSHTPRLCKPLVSLQEESLSQRYRHAACKLRQCMKKIWSWWKVQSRLTNPLLLHSTDFTNSREIREGAYASLRHFNLQLCLMPRLCTSECVEGAASLEGPIERLLSDFLLQQHPAKIFITLQ